VVPVHALELMVQGIGFGMGETAKAANVDKSGTAEALPELRAHDGVCNAGLLLTHELVGELSLGIDPDEQPPVLSIRGHR
jgi:hypothetical protein